MIFQSSGVQHRKRIKVGDDDDDDAKHGDDLVAAACGVDFWKKAPEDILLEIFIRLPDSRSAIRTATVCQHWHSLISHNPQFIPTFISHHQHHQYRLPYTIIFRRADRHEFAEFAGPQYFQPICKLFSDEELMFCTSPNFLDFMPCSPMVIRGSCNDLLLVSPGPRWSTQLYICNPITKQFIQLPEIPRPENRGDDHGVYGHALVCMPGPTNKSQFKVVEFRPIQYPDSDSELPHSMVRPVMLFCSESRKWEMRRFHYPRPAMKDAFNWAYGVACNGILYWLEFVRFAVDRVIYLDLSNDQCGAIDFPDDYCRGTCLARDQIGVVRVRGGEELRLLQVVLTLHMEPTVGLKVWKLSHNDHSEKKEWVLVHHFELKKANQSICEAVPFVHPTNGDVVFMVWGQEVFQYNLKDANAAKTYELMGKLEEGFQNNRILQFPVMHKNWPTQILT